MQALHAEVFIESMCSHSSSCEAITQEIQGQLYPAIATALESAKYSSPTVQFLAQEPRLNDVINSLKAEFYSLSNYEIKLVFPTILKLFNTKHMGANRPSVNVHELMSLTKKKEAVIFNLVDDIQIGLAQHKDKHDVLDSLLQLFQQDFKDKKKEWMSMLHGWSVGCACFRLADESTLSKGVDERS